MVKFVRVSLGVALLGASFIGFVRLSSEFWLREYTSVKLTVEEQRDVASEIERTALTDTIVEYNKGLDKMKLWGEIVPKIFLPSNLAYIDRIK